MDKKTKIIVFHSPLSQIGQTSIATMIALSLVNQGKYVAILELSRYTGMSVFLNKGLGNLKNDLKTCLIDPAKVKNNLVESRYSNKLFYLCQNVKNTATDLTSYNSANIDLIIDQLKGIFDYIFVDLPSDINDIAVVRVLSNKFTQNIDHQITLINENALALKKLNDYDNVISKSMPNTEERQKTTLIVNNSKVRYSPLFEPYLSDTPYSQIVNLVNIINLEEFPYLCNEGQILNLGKTKEAKEFLSSIDMVAKILEENIEGVGVSISKKLSKTIRKAKNTGIGGNFGEKEKTGFFSKNKNKAPKEKVKKPKKNKKGFRKKKQEQVENENVGYYQNPNNYDNNYDNNQMNFDDNMPN